MHNLRRLYKFIACSLHRSMVAYCQFEGFNNYAYWADIKQLNVDIWYVLIHLLFLDLKKDTTKFKSIQKIFWSREESDFADYFVFSG